MKTSIVLCLAVCIFTCKAFEFDESTVATADGDVLDVETIQDKHKSISIVKKDGKILEIQSSDDNVRYTIVKKDDTCIVTFNEEVSTGCDKAFEHDERYNTKEVEEINQECKGYNIDYVKAVKCKPESIQKRATCRRVCMIRIYLVRYNGKMYIVAIKRCYIKCS